jgi:general stress protein YciG
MDPAKQREIASKGGRAAHAKGTAHEFTSDEARVAGRKGGETVSRDRAHMSAIGREGGHSRGRARSQQPGVGEDLGRGMDTERSGYISQGNDRGTFGEVNRGNIGAPRNEQRSSEPQRNEQRGNEPRSNEQQRNSESGISR